MRLVFVSNYYNHHQAPFCEAVSALPGVDFHFVATEPMENERIAGGWATASAPIFVLEGFGDEESVSSAVDLINSADVVVFGSAPEWMIRQRQEDGHIVLRYSERIYKAGYEAYKLPVRLVRFYRKYGRYKRTYMLCASAFTAADFAKTHTFIGKCYRWGYFPECRRYEDLVALVRAKQDASILWVGRLIEWKHPEHVIEASRALLERGYGVKLTIVGNGPLEGKLKDMVRGYGMEGNVKFISVLSPSGVRDLMEKSQIFVFSSDFNEGWGAVLVEAMNSACAVVASHAIGSVPFLMKPGENGLVYKSGDVGALSRKIELLLAERRLREGLSLKAYETIAGLWNADTAAHRLVELCGCLLAGVEPPAFDDGPCSVAPILKNDWL